MVFLPILTTKTSFILLQRLTEYDTFVVCKNPTWARIQQGKARGKPGSVLCVFFDVCELKRAARCERVCVGVWPSLDGEGHVGHKPRRCSFRLSPRISASSRKDGRMMPCLSSFLQGVDLLLGTRGGGGGDVGSLPMWTGGGPALTIV